MFVVAAVCGVVCLSSWRKKWTIDDTPTSTCRGVFVGRNEVVGTAVPLYHAITTPFTQSQAVWFSWELEKYKGGDNNEWVTVESRSTAAPFWLQDDTGRVLVRPRKANLQTERSLTEKIDRDFAPPYSRWQLRQWVLVGEDVAERTTSMADPSFRELPTSPTGWLSLTPDTAGALSALSGKHRITEKSICVGDEIYLLGVAEPRADGPGLEFAGGGDEELLVSTKSEAQVASASGWIARLTGLGCLAASALWIGMITEGATGDPIWSFVIGIVAIELAVLFLLTLQRNYNRQVEVKQQAAKAWSMIDVSLRRRADLLPHLVGVVKGYAQHERGVQDTVAALRSDVALPAQEMLPTDDTLAAAEGADREIRATTASTVALGEAYPDLKATELFVDLQRRIADAEESVASARQFYNDAIEMLRTRRSQFPGSLFARLVDVPSWNLFEADEAATFVPAVAVAPEAAPSLEPAAGPAPAPGAGSPQPESPPPPASPPPPPASPSSSPPPPGSPSDGTSF